MAIKDLQSGEAAASGLSDLEARRARAAVIDGAQFEEARRDPDWIAFVEEAKEYRAELRRKRRSS